MELKDWLYILGLIITAGISASSLWISLVNRRNAMREHLYKEQFDFYKKLMEDICDITTLFVEIGEGSLSIEEGCAKADKMVLSMWMRVSKNYFIIPQSLEQKLHDVFDTSKAVILDIKQKGLMNDKEMDSITDTYFSLIEKLREEIGADDLSTENKLLFNGSLLGGTIRKTAKELGSKR